MAGGVINGAPNIIQGASFKAPQFYQDPYRQQYGYEPQPQQPSVMQQLALGVGGGLGEGISAGIKNQLRQSLVNKALQSLPQNGTPEQMYQSLLQMDPETRQELLPLIELRQQTQQENQRKMQEQQQQQAAINAAASTFGFNAQQQPMQNVQGAESSKGKSQLSPRQQENQNFLNNIALMTPEDRKQALKDRKEQTEFGITFNKDYKNELNKDFENYNMKKSLLTNMDRLNENDELGTPALHTLLDKLGLPTGFINNPSAEEYEKFSQQMMNDISSLFPGRILDKELQSYAKQIPTLMNTKEGRSRIIRDLKNLNEARKIKYQTYLELSEGGKYLPTDLREQVTQASQAKLQKIEQDLHDSAEYFKPITMTKDGKSYSIPATYVTQALMKGYNLAGENEQGSVNPQKTNTIGGHPISAKNPLNQYMNR